MVDDGDAGREGVERFEGIGNLLTIDNSTCFQYTVNPNESASIPDRHARIYIQWDHSLTLRSQREPYVAELHPVTRIPIQVSLQLSITAISITIVKKVIYQPY